jgi:hypothetical protein
VASCSPNCALHKIRKRYPIAAMAALPNNLPLLFAIDRPTDAADPHRCELALFRKCVCSFAISAAKSRRWEFRSNCRKPLARLADHSAGSRNGAAGRPELSKMFECIPRSNSVRSELPFPPRGKAVPIVTPSPRHLAVGAAHPSPFKTYATKFIVQKRLFRVGNLANARLVSAVVI